MIQKIPETDADRLNTGDISRDFVALLRFDSGLISLPVVQTDNNSFYLNHAYDGSLSDCGTLFFDMQTQRNDMIRLIYGHTVSGCGDLMFTPLHRLLDEDTLRHNRIFRLYYPDCTETYETEMILVTDPSDSSGTPTRIRFLDREELILWKQKAESCAVWQGDTDLCDGDRLVILQTCMSENSPLRLCIIAKEIQSDIID